jgi:hypothetical protein
MLVWKYKPSGKRIKGSRRCWREAFVCSEDKIVNRYKKHCVQETVDVVFVNPHSSIHFPAPFFCLYSNILLML